jgi:hypothetical protein
MMRRSAVVAFACVVAMLSAAALLQAAQPDIATLRRNVAAH